MEPFTKPLLPNSSRQDLSLPVVSLRLNIYRFYNQKVAFFKVQCLYSSPNHNTFMTRQVLQSPNWSLCIVTQPHSLTSTHLRNACQWLLVYSELCNHQYIISQHFLHTTRNPMPTGRVIVY